MNRQFKCLINRRLNSFLGLKRRTSKNIESHLCKSSQNHLKSEAGFALPTALTFGLIVVMASSALLIRSQDDRVAASIQQTADSSLNVAEGGITRIQSFINNNRAIATYNLSDWLNPSTRMSHLFSSCGSMTTTQLSTFASTATTWQDIDASDASKGQFRLVNYTYTANNPSQPNSAPGTGTLDVEGRLPGQQSINRLRITIPVQPGDVTGVPVPGLWASSGGISGNAIQGNVLLNDCRVALDTVRTVGNDPVTGQPYSARHTTFSQPALPPKPVLLNALPSTTIRENITLPRLNDVATTKVIQGQSVQVYEYAVSSLSIAQNSSLTITPGTRVTFYLDGNINKGGDIIHNCGTPASAGCSPTNFQIFGYGGDGSSICLNGTNYIDAFVLAPNYGAGVAGSGGGQGGFRGAVWVKTWETSGGCGSNTRNITVIQTANWDFIGLTPQNLPPKIAPASSWTRLEIPR